MARCQYTEVCPFFTDEVGYSIDLQAMMRLTYCLGDATDCARLKAMDYLPLEEIPDDLLPTEHTRLLELAEEYRRNQDAS